MTFLINLINHLPEWKAETIKEENLQDALEVLNTNIAGYYADTQEELPTLENLRQDIQALPPGCTLEEKVFILLYRDDSPIAIIDYVENYPDTRSGYIGLFLLRHSVQKQGLGKKLFVSLEPSCHQNRKAAAWSWDAMKPTMAGHCFLEMPWDLRKSAAREEKAVMEWKGSYCRWRKYFDKKIKKSIDNI